MDWKPAAKPSVAGACCSIVGYSVLKGGPAVFYSATPSVDWAKTDARNPANCIRLLPATKGRGLLPHLDIILIQT